MVGTPAPSSSARSSASMVSGTTAARISFSGTARWGFASKYPVGTLAAWLNRPTICFASSRLMV